MDENPIHITLAGTRVAKACRPATQRELIDRLFSLPDLAALQVDQRRGRVRLEFSPLAQSVPSVLSSIGETMLRGTPASLPLLHEDLVFTSKARRNFEVRRWGTHLTFWRVEAASSRVFFISHPLLRSEIIRRAAVGELERYSDAVQRVIPVGKALMVLVRPFRMEASVFPEVLDPVLTRSLPEATDLDSPHVQSTLTNANLALAPVSDFLFPPAGIANAALTGILTQKSFPLAWAEWRQGKFSLQSLNALVVGLTILAFEFFPMALMYWLGRFWSRRTETLCDFQQTHFLARYRHQAHRVWIERGGVSVEIPLEELTPSSVVVLNSGDVIPGDGILVEGEALVNEDLFTGVSKPVRKGRDSALFAGTKVVEGTVRMTVQAFGDRTAAARLAEKFRRLLQESRSEFGSPVCDRAERAVLPTMLASGAALLSGGLTGMRSALRPDFLTGAAMSEEMLSLSAVIRGAREGVTIGSFSALALLRKADYFVFDDSTDWSVGAPSRDAFRQASLGSGKAVLFTSRAGAEAAALAAELGFLTFRPASTEADKLRFLDEVRASGQLAVYIGDLRSNKEAANAAALFVPVAEPPYDDLTEAALALMSPDLGKFALLLGLAREIQQESETAFRLTWIPNVVAILGAIVFRSPVMASVLLTNLGILANYARSGTILQLAAAGQRRQP